MLIHNTDNPEPDVTLGCGSVNSHLGFGPKFLRPDKDLEYAKYPYMYATLHGTRATSSVWLQFFPTCFKCNYLRDAGAEC
jgi:hypothetical protein